MAELDRLRRAYREIERDGSEHLSEDQWERLACEEMSPAEKDESLDHILGCAECSEVYRALMVVRREARTFDRGVPGTARESAPGRTRNWRGLLVGLAAAAAVVVAVIVIRPQQVTHPPTPPAGQAFTLRSGGTIPAPNLGSPLGALGAAPEAFTWHEAPGARAYVVELFDADGELLWKSGELEAASAPWPETVPRGPGRYYWRVLAIPKAGGKPVASDLASFEVGISASPR